MDKQLELKLRNDFLTAYKTAQKKYNFKSPRFIRMLNEHGAFETAKRLTDTISWQKGYEKLAFLGRTDLTVEHIILKEEYSKHFTDKQIHNAKQKIQSAKEIKGHSY